MKRQLYYLIISLFLLLPSLTEAQRMRLYNTQQGMQTCDINNLHVDSRGLLWIGGASQLCYFGGNYFNYIDNHSPETGQVLYNNVRQVFEDKEDFYWVVTDGGLFYLNMRTLVHEKIKLNPEDNLERMLPVRQMIDLTKDGGKKLVYTDGFGVYVLNNDNHTVDNQLTSTLQGIINENFITSAVVDSQGYLWVAKVNRELMRIDLEKGAAVEIRMSPDAARQIRSYAMMKMQEVPERHAIYMTTDGGILKYDTDSQILKEIPFAQHFPFTSLLSVDKDQLLVGSDSHGLWVINAQDKVKPYKLVDIVYDLSMGKVKDIIRDRQGNIMIALMQKGIYILPKRANDFQHFIMSLYNDGRNTCCVTDIQQDKDGIYWIATDGAGIFKAAQDGLDSAHPVNAGLNSMQTQAIAFDKRGTVWVGSYGGGVQYYDTRTGRFESPEWEGELLVGAVMGMCYDERQDMLYVATNGMGVYAMDLVGKTCKPLQYNDSQIAWTSDVYIDSEGTLWICEAINTYYLNSQTGKKGMIQAQKVPGQPICINGVGTEKKKILIGTTAGLVIYDTAKDEVTRMLDNIKVLSINVTDSVVYAATPNSIYAINRNTLHTQQIKNFGYFLGEFHKTTTMQNNKGELLWGCDNGILSFAPDVLQQPHKLHNKVVLTRLAVGGRFISYQKDSEILDSDIVCAARISLKHNDNSFSLSFVTPDFSGLNNITYKYMLDGYDKEWNTTDLARISYSMLDPGTYTLHIKAYIDDEEAQDITERIITIHVETPWWKRWWAYLIYILIAMAVLGTLIKVWIQKKQRQQELQQALHNEEIKDAKLQLFTSIAHELRSPLTMIVTPLRYLMTTIQDEDLLRNLNIMQQNCNRLLNTVRQITDIRRIDAGQFQLHFQEVNISQYVDEMSRPFLGAAMVRKINLTVESKQPDIMVWIDTVHFEKVIVNILSNAFKFTPEEGNIRITCTRKEQEVEITFYNEGEHIPDDDMGRLYERFFQSRGSNNKNGSGIGLNLCYELMQLHHGSIEARNIDPKGVEFIVRLPLGCSHLTAEELSPREDTKENTEENTPEQTIPMPEQPEEPIAVEDIIPEKDTVDNKAAAEHHSSRPRLLIVDDDLDICNYLSEHLQPKYSVMTAHGGNSAWEIALHHRPDIIITDVMMPDGNGIELAQKIKSNPEMDNIPLIMVTGEDNEQLQLKSLQLNVDHYLQKPFNISILEATIKQALTVRKNTKKHVKRADFREEYGEMEIDSAEDKLFLRVTEALMKNLDNSEYTVMNLSKDVGISRVHLNRKMKDRFGLSPTAFIRTFRMKQAAHLLSSNRVNVSEVAYKVGYTTHSHFTSTFRDYFGMSPKDFVTFYKKEENKEALRKLLE